MFKEQKFIKSIVSSSEIPKLRLPEIVLCGRSNVGKSSFINSLFNRKDLAKVSSTPGKTRTINYYQIDNKFYLVDLPGYGYAKVSIKEREKWGRIIEDYFHNSGKIVWVFHILDSRHKPSILDIKLNEMSVNLGYENIFILNKSDKLKQSEKKNALLQVKSVFPLAKPSENMFFYSSVKHVGKKEILSLLSSKFY